MSSNLAIHAQNLSKAFQLYDRPIDRLKQMLMRVHLEGWQKRSVQ